MPSVWTTTTNFERDLADIESFLTEAKAPQALLFFNRAIRSAEAAHAIASIKAKLASLMNTTDGLREYVMDNYLVLYVQVSDSIFLLSIKHHRQLSFDFEAHWGAGA